MPKTTFLINDDPKKLTVVQKYILDLLDAFDREHQKMQRPWCRRVMIEFAEVNRN